jgi:hypothetical protein
MKKIALLALVVPALAIAACGGKSGDKDGYTQPGGADNVDECPRADNEPCR